MQPVELFSLQRSSDENAVKSNLLHNGANTGYAIHGFQLMQQFELPHYYLLFANYDCPFEESCEITVVNRELKPVAHKSIGAWYSSFWLESVEHIDNDTFKLIFNEDTEYQLLVNYPKKFAWTFSGWKTLNLVRS